MNFLNVWMLMGAAASLLPLLIYLLQRPPRRAIAWGAMFLLEVDSPVQRRRSDWENRWLLLLLRCLIPLVWAACLARPVLNYFVADSSGQPRAVTLLLDDSLSMSAGQGEQQRWQHALAQVRAFGELSTVSEIHVRTTAGPAAVAVSHQAASPPQWTTALAQLDAPAGSSQANHAIRQALQQPSPRESPQRQIVLTSDFQAAEWSQVSPADLSGLRGQLHSGPHPIQLFLLPVQTASVVPNLSIHVEPSPATALVQQAYRWRVRVVNHAPQPAASVHVRFQLAGREIPVGPLALPPGGSEVIPLECEFSMPGWHILSARVDDPRGMPGDDVCFHVLQAVLPPAIVILDDSHNDDLAESASRGRPASGSVQLPTAAPRFVGTSRFVELALAPFAASERNPFRVQRMTSQQFLESSDLACDAVVVADVAELSDGLQEELLRFVHSGGGVLVFPPADAQSWPGSISLSGLLPMGYGPERTADAATAARLVWPPGSALASRFPLASLDGSQQLKFLRWRAMTADENASDQVVLLKLEPGEPWLVEQTLGSGLVIQCASGCSDADSNWTSQPVFVPWMNLLTGRLVGHAARSRNIATGQTVAFHLTAQAERSRLIRRSTPLPSLGRGELRITRALSAIPVEQISESTEGIVVAENQPGVFAGTRWPGVLAAEVESAALGAEVEPRLVSVNTPAFESQLQMLDEPQLQSLADQLGATLISSAADYERHEQLRRLGWEVWRWGIVAVLGLLFAEQCLANRRGAVAVRGER